MSSGLILGLVNRKVTLVEGVKALFDSGRTSESACRTALRSCYRKQPPDLVRLSNNSVHTAIFAPTGSGKGVSLVIPFLLTCPEACVVMDFKGENYQITADARRRMGHKVVCLDPFDLVGGTDTLNPLDSIGSDLDPGAPDDCASLAKSLVVREAGEKEAHWNDSAEAWIKAMIALVAAEGDENRSLQTIRPLLTDEKKMRMAIQIMQGSSAWEGFLSRCGHQLTHAKEKELGSVLTTINRNLNWLDTPAIIKNTRESSFNPTDLWGGKMTIFLVLHPKYQRSHAALIRMWIDTLMRVVILRGLSNRKVHFLMDEAASLGHLPILDDAVDKYRGFGIRCQFYYQSIGQLQLCWPDGRDQTLLSNTSQVFFGVNDPGTAEHISKRLGEYTQILTSGGTNRGGSYSQGNGGDKNSSTSWGASDNWAQAARHLLKLDEVMTLNQRYAITFTPGMRPILTWLVRYYEGFLPRRMGKVRMAVDAVCLLLATSLLAVMFTAAIYYHTFE